MDLFTRQTETATRMGQQIGQLAWATLWIASEGAENFEEVTKDWSDEQVSQLKAYLLSTAPLTDE